MEHPETWIVSAKNGVRPAGKPDACFYCGRKVGETHTKECVCRQRTVVLRYTVDLPVNIPATWSQESVEFHRNDSSWCANNVASELERMAAVIKSFDEQGKCVCPVFKAEYLGEASAEQDALVDLSLYTETQ